MSTWCSDRWGGGQDHKAPGAHTRAVTCRPAPGLTGQGPLTKGRGHIAWMQTPRFHSYRRCSWLKYPDQPVSETRREARRANGPSSTAGSSVRRPGGAVGHRRRCSAHGARRTAALRLRSGSACLAAHRAGCKPCAPCSPAWVCRQLRDATNAHMRRHKGPGLSSWHGCVWPARCERPRRLRRQAAFVRGRLPSHAACP